MFVNVDIFRLLTKHVNMIMMAFYLLKTAPCYFFFILFIHCMNPMLKYTESRFYDFFELFSVELSDARPISILWELGGSKG